MKELTEDGYFTDEHDITLIGKQMIIRYLNKKLMTAR